MHRLGRATGLAPGIRASTSATAGRRTTTTTTKSLFAHPPTQMRAAQRLLLLRLASSPRRGLATARPAPASGTPSNTIVRPQYTGQGAGRPMERMADRPLPSLRSLSSVRMWARTLPIFVALITVSALAIFNYQKVNSPIVTATLYSLRTNPRVRHLLGSEVYFASRWAWIWGTINLVQGRVDIQFAVKGSRRHGLCRFKAVRAGGRNGSWLTQEWSLTIPDLAADSETAEMADVAGPGGPKEPLVIQLLDGPAGSGPLAAASF